MARSTGRSWEPDTSTGWWQPQARGCTPDHPAQLGGAGQREPHTSTRFQARLPAPSRPLRPHDTVKPQPPGRDAAYWAGHASPAPNQSSAGRASSGPAQTVHIPGPATDHRRGIPWPTDTACRALPTVAQRARGWACCRFPPPPPMGPPQGLLPTASLCDQSRAAPAGLGCPTRQQGLLPSGVDLRHLHPLCPGVTPAHGPAEPHSLAPGHPWSSGDVNGGQPGQRRPSRGRTLTYPLPVVTLNPRGDWRTARCSAHQGGHLSMRM